MFDWNPSERHFKEITHYPFIHDDKTNVDYFLGTINVDTLICCFEATCGERDWQSDFDYLPGKFDIYPGSKILVHEGLAKQYLGARNNFLDMVYGNPAIKKVCIAGYSLGGGIAQLACQDIAWHFENDPSLKVRGLEIVSISYEGPRVFTPNTGVKKLLRNRQILIKTWWDPVVHVPFKNFSNPGLRILGISPFKIGWGKPSFTRWRDYGTVIWIGKWNRILPLQHYSEQVEKNLFEKYNT